MHRYPQVSITSDLNFVYRILKVFTATNLQKLKRIASTFLSKLLAFESKLRPIYTVKEATMQQA